MRLGGSCTSFSATLCRSLAPAAGMSKRQNSHSVRAAALCCSQRARNVISPLSPLGRIARIADSNCPSRRRELHKIPLWRCDAAPSRGLRSEIDWFRFLRSPCPSCADYHFYFLTWTLFKPSHFAVL